MKITTSLPVAIIGAGPIGLAAAAHAVSRGLTPIIFEKGAAVGAAMREWGHVRVFSPWQYNIDTAARALLLATGWDAPEDTDLPTGAEIATRYLEPLSALPAIEERLHLGATVTAITRQGRDKVSNDRSNAPFDVRWTDADGHEHSTIVGAVVDASGTWARPNPIGVDGLPVPGERASERVAYGIPDVTGAARNQYAGRTTLVVGSGHSAINAALALLTVQQDVPGTKILWALRRNRIERLLGGGLNDQLPERGALGLAAKEAIDTGRLQLLAPFAAKRLTLTGDTLVVDAEIGAAPIKLEVDRIIVATGFRPELNMLAELRVAVDPATEAPPALSRLIDPNVHSCGTVPPHGAVELAHPEEGFYIVGAKSYGRAPTFLMATGYEQVRSVMAELAGDFVAAREVQLVLPETGVCSVTPVSAGASCCGTSAAVEASSCCGGPATTSTSCCVDDEVAKQKGEAGCGCGTPARTTTKDLASA